MSNIGIMELLFLLLIPASIAGVIIGVVTLSRRNKAKTERSQAFFGAGGPALASVTAKRTYDWPDRTAFYVTFQLGAQPPVEVEVTREWYEYLTPGDQGQLLLQGNQFVQFNRVG